MLSFRHRFPAMTAAAFLACSVAVIHAWEEHANRLGTTYHASTAAFAAQTPYKFTQEAGPGRTTFWANEIGAFVSDQIQVKRNLQISLSLRYDSLRLSETFVDQVTLSLCSKCCCAERYQWRISWPDRESGQ